VPIGKITKVTPANGQIAQTASVAPFVDFGSLDIVAVVVDAPESIKHNSLLPASPTPAPTVTVTVTASPGSTSGGGTPGSPDSTPTASVSSGTTPSNRVTSSANGGRSAPP
jgi:rod shape-determining protein MreC